MTPAQASHAARTVALAAASDAGPLQVQGKFFFAGERKLFLRAVSYGPFKTGSHGTQFPERDMVERDFALMSELGANVVRTFTVPPRWLLDRAEAHDLRIMIGIPWAEHVCFLDQPRVTAEIRETVQRAVRDSLGHPAVFAYMIGNEIPPDIVRWYGPERMQAFLRVLCDDVKALAPRALVSYANFPPTEYLDLEFLDFVCFNVYLHHEDAFRRYLGRLQNIAGDRPLVLTEHGIDSVRLGEDVQAATLAWQVRAAFESGLAGTCVFSWTDDWFTGGFQIEDWSFGLVTRDRQRKPAFHAIQAQYAAPLPPALRQYPKVSVVICAYDAERTMDACLASLERIRYPNYDVVIVNDGSRDATRAIAERYVATRPHLFTLVNQPNKGLSVARNVGMEAASGDIVAYTDSDCVVDRDWLTYLVYKFQAGFVAVGGPNFPPPEDSAIAAYVAASPGGPTHVLLNDEVAEHIPGCNMAFRKRALAEVGGFQPIFTAAGDDVDVCWRLQNHGHVIGFSPSAMVWHFRRNTVRDYFKQQRGYGKAEALLYFKHPYRFNMLGQSRWLGRIYGDFTTSLFSRRPVIYSGTFGRGLFQTLYEPPSSLFASLPFTLEWNVVAAMLLVAAIAAGKYLTLAALPLAITLVSAAASARNARIDARHDHWRGRMLVAVLIYLGPLLRSYERYRWRVKGLTDVERIRFAEMRQAPRIRWLGREFFLRYWSDRGQEKEELLEGVIRFLLPRKYLIAHDLGWSDWDLEIHRGLATTSQLRVAVENHGGTKRLFNVRCAIKTSRVAKLAFGCTGGLVAVGVYLLAPELLTVAVLLAVLVAGSIFYQAVRLGRTMYQVLEIVAQQIGLGPMGADS
ncbi:MAG: glycosyltransferase [Deltaproteobacteria bacterium]|nr:glycosyltransferase [Deltaproteobacteria bacterium]